MHSVQATYSKLFLQLPHIRTLNPKPPKPLTQATYSKLFLQFPHMFWDQGKEFIMHASDSGELRWTTLGSWSLLWKGGLETRP